LRKSLPSRYFYDELGSALFDAITHLPEYYPTRLETEILTEQGWEIVRALDGPVEFLELGSGSAIKTRILIDEALRAQGTLRYTPIDISPDALLGSARVLLAAARARLRRRLF
jgi:L-histidine N-alpha-methyltransferase